MENPPTSTSGNKSSADQTLELAAVRRELETLNSHRFITMHNSLWRLFAMRFVSGLFTGLGTVIGATVLVSILAVWLQRIEWVPLIGDWASGIASEIERNLDETGGASPTPEPNTDPVPDTDGQ